MTMIDQMRQERLLTFKGLSCNSRNRQLGKDFFFEKKKKKKKERKDLDDVHMVLWNISNISQEETVK